MYRNFKNNFTPLIISVGCLMGNLANGSSVDAGCSGLDEGNLPKKIKVAAKSYSSECASAGQVESLKKNLDACAEIGARAGLFDSSIKFILTRRTSACAALKNSIQATNRLCATHNAFANNVKKTGLKAAADTTGQYSAYNNLRDFHGLNAMKYGGLAEFAKNIYSKNDESLGAKFRKKQESLSDLKMQEEISNLNRLIEPAAKNTRTTLSNVQASRDGAGIHSGGKKKYRTQKEVDQAWANVVKCEQASKQLVKFEKRYQEQVAVAIGYFNSVAEIAEKNYLAEEKKQSDARNFMAEEAQKGKGKPPITDNNQNAATNKPHQGQGAIVSPSKPANSSVDNSNPIYSP